MNLLRHLGSEGRRGLRRGLGVARLRAREPPLHRLPRSHLRAAPLQIRIRKPNSIPIEKHDKLKKIIKTRKHVYDAEL